MSRAHITSWQVLMNTINLTAATCLLPKHAHLQLSWPARPSFVVGLWRSMLDLFPHFLHYQRENVKQERATLQVVGRWGAKLGLHQQWHYAAIWIAMHWLVYSTVVLYKWIYQPESLSNFELELEGFQLYVHEEYSLCAVATGWCSVR